MDFWVSLGLGVWVARLAGWRRPIQAGLRANMVTNLSGDLVKVELSDEQVEDVRNGRFISLMSEKAELTSFYKEKLVAILEKREAAYKPRKVFL